MTISGVLQLDDVAEESIFIRRIAEVRRIFPSSMDERQINCQALHPVQHCFLLLWEWLLLSTNHRFVQRWTRRTSQLSSSRGRTSPVNFVEKKKKKEQRRASLASVNVRRMTRAQSRSVRKKTIHSLSAKDVSHQYNHVTVRKIERPQSSTHHWHFFFSFLFFSFHCSFTSAFSFVSLHFPSHLIHEEFFRLFTSFVSSTIDELSSVRDGISSDPWTCPAQKFECRSSFPQQLAIRRKPVDVCRHHDNGDVLLPSGLSNELTPVKSCDLPILFYLLPLQARRMSIGQAKDIQKKEDLLQWIKVGQGEASNADRHRRGLIIVPGGGGKSTFVEKCRSSSISCADIDQYWQSEKEKEEEKLRKMIDEWQVACLNPENLQRRRALEDEFVLLKAELCREKWSGEEVIDLLFIQTVSQSSILLTDPCCSSLNLLPTESFHEENLRRRSQGLVNPPDDYQVCRRQWTENEREKNYLLYENFEEFECIVRLFHQMINTSI